MKYFADSVIHPHIANLHYRDFCEIGASYGENTDRLLENPAARITIIDPCLDTDLEAKYADRDNVQVRKGLSLAVLPHVSECFDCILIDGDHNWYTVYHELDAISQGNLLKPGGTIFLHDVGWPYGRRDMYYQPDTIPAEFVHPNLQRGIIHGQRLLAEEGGNNDVRYNAVHSGGAKNGVLTAVEDFLAAHPGEYWFTSLPDQHGLGVIFRRKAWLEDTAFFFLWLRVVAMKLENFVRPRKKKLAAAAALLVIAPVLSRWLASSKRRR